MRILQRIPDARLSAEMDDPVETMAGEQGLHCVSVFQSSVDESKAFVVRKLRQAVLFQLWIIVVVHVVEADNVIPSVNQRFGHVIADKASRSGDENPHCVRLLPVLFRFRGQ
jgi:hypothetical protein